MPAAQVRSAFHAGGGGVTGGQTLPHSPQFTVSMLRALQALAAGHHVVFPLPAGKPPHCRRCQT